MAYTKMTVADFMKRLKNGDYADATGARRGAGKANLTDAEKDQCRRAIDKHFGSSPVQTKKPVQKKAKAVSKKVAKKALTNGKAEHKSAAPTEPKTRGRKPREPRMEVDVPSLTLNKSDNELLVALHLAKERIGTITQAVQTMHHAKETYPELDTKEGMTVAAASLTQIMTGVQTSLRVPLQMTDAPVSQQVMETLARTAPGAVGLPGQDSPVQMPEGYQQNVS